MEKRKMAVFASGGGTNCENLIRYFTHSPVGEVSVVVSNKPDAGALEKARRLGVPTEVINKTLLADASFMLPMLQRYGVDMVILAGFLPLVPDFLIEAYPQRIINLHPSLLPRYGGKGMWGHHVHEAVKANGDTETGMTVHYVSPVCDGGQIIAQFRTPVAPTDSAEDIAEKEHQLEMQYFPKVIEKLMSEL